MVCLGIDTSGETLSVGLCDGGKILGERSAEGGNPHSVVILPEIEALLKEAGVKGADVSLVSVTGGPGRYTALRVGMATAKGLAYSWDVPLARVSTLEALAVSLQPHRGPVVPVLDARRQLVYYAIFEAAGDSLKRLEDDQAVPYAAAASSIPERSLLTGDGVSLITPHLREVGTPYATRDGAIRGGIVARLGEATFMSRGTNEILEGPVYIRKVEIHGRGLHNNPNG